MRWLQSELEHRDPKDKLHDIETGAYMYEMSTLPANLIQMMEDGNMHAELRLVNDRYRVVKIVKKREPEFLQGTERHFIFNSEGKRIPLTEEEFDVLLKMESNPEDLYNTEDIDLQTLDSEHVAPMDRWDVIFDATDYIQQCERLINNDRWQAQPIKQKIQDLEDLKSRIYSADWFPYPADKRVQDPRAKKIAARIAEGMTKRQLGAAIGPRVVDKRPDIASDLRREAAKKQSGREKAQLLTRAQSILDSVYKDRRNGKGMNEPIGSSDRAKLWSLWREAEMRNTGEVQLMSWQFEKALRHKLDIQVQKEEMTLDQATVHLKDRMASLFNLGNIARCVEHQIEAEMLPDWILINDAPIPDEPLAEGHALQLELEDAEYEFVNQNWLPGSWAAEEDDVPDDDEYINSLLLSDGGME